jgi:hypothetical protein
VIILGAVRKQVSTDTKILVRKGIIIAKSTAENNAVMEKKIFLKGKGPKISLFKKKKYDREDEENET